MVDSHISSFPTGGGNFLFNAFLSSDGTQLVQLDKVQITSAGVNHAPAATVPSSITQQTNGSGYLSFQTTISDVDSNDTKLKVEYSDDGGTNWHDPKLVSVTPSSGSVNLKNTDPYQIGTTDAIDTSGGDVTLTIIWDTKSHAALNNADQTDIKIRVTPNDFTVDGTVQSSGNFEVDNLDPSGLTSLNVDSTTTTTATLSWSAVTETNFDHYEIWYGKDKSDVEHRTGTASEWDNSNDSNLTNKATTSTTITGLSLNTDYHFEIWAIDQFGNEQTVPEVKGKTKKDNTAPSATVPGSITQYTNGSGYVTFQTTISDADLNDTKLQVEYSDNGGTNWYDPDLVSATPSSGSVDLTNANAYQIGTSNAIDTSTGSITLTIIWNTKSAANGHGSLDGTDQSDIKVRVTPNDSTVDGTPQTSGNFRVDNQPSAISSTVVSPNSGIVKVGNTLTITLTAGEAGLTIGPAGCTVNGINVNGSFTDHGNKTYTLTYTVSEGQSDWTAGNLPISCQLKDGFGNTGSTSAFTDGNTVAGDANSPTGLTALNINSTTTNSATLSWSAVLETNFDHYEIWYGTNQSDVQNRAGSASKWDNSNDANLANKATTSTTITGLSVSTTYYFKIWAVDQAGNKETVPDISGKTNTAPTATAPSSISQATNATGYVTFQTTLSDADLDNTKLKVEYSDDGGTNWYNPDLVSAIPSSGSVDLTNANAYQIGTSNAIDSSTGNNTLTIVWLYI